MKKNRLIEQNLNNLAASARLNPDTVRDAAFELARAGETKRPSRRRIFGTVAAACAVIAAVIVSVVLIRAGNTPPPSNAPRESYKLSVLASDWVAEPDLGAIPFSDLENAEMVQKTYSRNGEVEVVATKIINATDRGTDQIIVYEDLGGGLTDFSGYKKYAEQDFGGVIVNIVTEHKNAEYYSYCRYNEDETDYYIIIMSPLPDAAGYYFENIYNSRTNSDSRLL